jgi:hypothetical protein
MIPLIVVGVKPLPIDVFFQPEMTQQRASQGLGLVPSLAESNQRSKKEKVRLLAFARTKDYREQVSLVSERSPNDKPL